MKHEFGCLIYVGCNCGKKKENKMKLINVFLLLAFLTGVSGCSQYPPYNVWSQRLEGEAELARSQAEKQVQIQDAESKYEAAKSLAKAEIERAKGVAQANAIIGDSLKNNEAYLRWLYIEGLKERTGVETIYVPTEAGIPILEAGHRGTAKP